MTKLKLIVLQVGDNRMAIHDCDDCPLHIDPDPYPSFCKLDKNAIFPTSCPLPNLTVEVIRE